MKRHFLIYLLLLCFMTPCFAQGIFTMQNKKKVDKIRFKLINNLIIIPVEINGVELSFLLDTGVSKPIIFNFLNVSDTLKIKNTETIFLRGLGNGETVEALKSRKNIFRIGDALNINQDLYAVYDASLNFAPRLGVPVHGIIGFDLFKDFVVEINYTSRFIRLSDPRVFQYKKCKKCEYFNLEFYNNKPYINASVKMDGKSIPIKLLIDSGGSDALWLFDDKDLGINIPEKNFDDFLGHGLSGSVYGKRAQIEEFSLKRFTLKKANVAFPDSISIAYAKKFKGRNGSLAGNILKRFNLIIDYRKAKITLKKNMYFKQKFSYNKSGIELEHHGVRFIKEKDIQVSRGKSEFGKQSSQPSSNRIVLDTKYKLTLKPAYAIVELRKDSPAMNAGLQLGDVILTINSKSSYLYTLQEITELFYAEEGKRIKLKVERENTILEFTFRLESLFK